MMEHGSVFIHALQHTSIPETIPTLIQKQKKQYQQHGIHCYRIEELQLVVSHSFCTADCYLVVSMEQEESHLFMWLGKEAELEKKCACAMWAVTLRQKLGIDTSIQRIEQGTEPSLFLSLFPDFHVLDASYGTRSVLRPVLAYPVMPRLYQWQGHCVLVPFGGILSEDHVYLYIGERVAQWNGPGSSVVDQCKAGLVLSVLGQVHVVEKEELLELCSSFQEGSRSSQGSGSQSHPSELAEVPEENIDWDTKPLLYRLQEEPVLVPRPWHRSLLKTVSHVLDLGVELYVWHPPHTLLNGLQDIVSSRSRPCWFRVETVVPGSEPFLFRWFFGDWITPRVSVPVLPCLYPTVEQRERIPFTGEEIESWFEKVNALVRDRHCFVYTQGSYEPFHGKEYDLSSAYFFLFEYEAPRTFFEQWDPEELWEWEEDEVECRTVGFFLTTPKTSHKARYLLYYQFLPSLPVVSLVVESSWGWEHPCFLAHVGNLLWFGGEGIMEIRTDKRYKTTRIMGVDCISSNACYYHQGIVWKGSNVSSHGWQVCSTLLEDLFDQIRICEEWNEEMQEWFGVDPILLPGIAPQWFVLSASTGRLTVEYRLPTHRDIMFVECGEVYIWMGVEASELLLRWMQSIAQPHMHMEHQYYESSRFKKLFPLWW
jgi:hypothetical protein